tara:strand:+ start:1498 stop:1746 length:249 start_codon:yes stop_codon:yes gene_type:complete
LLFKGSHTKLVDGNYYTYLELADAIGAKYSCIKNRLCSKKFATPNDLYPPHSKRDRSKPPQETLLLETQSMMIMDKYLRRKL